MATTSQKNSTIKVLRQGVSNILNGVAQINEAIATDAITGVLRGLTDADLNNENEGLTADQVRLGAAALAQILGDLKDAQKNPEVAGRIYDIRL